MRCLEFKRSGRNNVQQRLIDIFVFPGTLILRSGMTRMSNCLKFKECRKPVRSRTAREIINIFCRRRKDNVIIFRQVAGIILCQEWIHFTINLRPLRSRLRFPCEVNFFYKGAHWYKVFCRLSVRNIYQFKLQSYVTKALNRGIPISLTLDFSNLLITRTKRRFPLLPWTL